MNNLENPKQRRWLIISLISTIIVLLGTIIYFTKTENLSGVKNILAKADSSASHSISEEESNFPGISIVSDISNDELSPYALQYPKTTNDEFNQHVMNYINDSKDSYLKVIKYMKDNSNSDSLINELNITFETYQFDENYYSFVFTKRQSLHNAETETKMKTILFNSVTEEIVPIQHVLSNDIRNLETFLTYIRSVLSENEDLASKTDKAKIKDFLVTDWETVTNFAIDKENLVVYFDEGTIAPKDSGTISLNISMSFLNPILATEFQKEMIDQSENIQVIDDKRKRVALTFDDGPHPTVTKQILSHLDKYDAKATFFMLGNRIQYYPEVAVEVRNRGHEIGNHTWSHPVLPKLSMDKIMYEFNSTEEMIETTLGQKSSVFRPPYGAITDAIEAAIPRKSVNWTVDTMDWKYRNASQPITAIKKQIHNNAVILMHDIHQSTADGLPAVLEFLSNEGYEFVTVSELIPFIK